MNMATKHEIIHEYLPRYLKADRRGKTAILDQVCAVTGYPRKSAIRAFHNTQMMDVSVPERRGRPKRYTKETESALHELHALAHEICAERLHPMIKEYVRILSDHGQWDHDEETTTLLCSMSLGAVKARISGTRKLHGRKGRAMTKPSLLKEIVPIRHGPWENPEPGTGEVDTVAHCGGSTDGDYAYTVQYTDIAVPGWTVLAAQWNKGEIATTQSIERIERRLPWDLRWLDPDSGSEFINWHLQRWTKKRNVRFTRTRPYMKNDHARVEQKNYTNIRQFVGYHQYDDPKAVPLLNELYDVLEDYINFFIPSMKTTEKIPIEGSKKCRRIHDVPQTPYQRALAHPKVPEEVKQRLREKYATLNPASLKKDIDRICSKLRKTVRRR
jgi:uncharacterized protein (UPF0297 family)